MKYKLQVTAADGFCFPVVESDTPFLGFSEGEFVDARFLQPHPNIVCNRYKIVEVTHYIVHKEGILFSHMVDIRVEGTEV